MFEKLGAKFENALSKLRSRGRLSTSDIKETFSEIRSALLDSDVALDVVEDFVNKTEGKALELLPNMQAGSNPATAIFELIQSEITLLLGATARRIRFAKNPPTVIMLTGLQGAGKTTLAGKLAKYFLDQGNTPILIACDLQRPNAVTQLQVIGEQIKVPVFAPEPGNGQGDPISVAKSGLDFARQKLHNLVIVDTAGRLGVDEEMMQQAKDIRNVISPDEVLFVVDSMIGQDAVKTAKAFNEGVGIDGLVLTKLDGDARGGAALSIASVTGKPIFFASTGEKISDFDLFYPDRMAQRILGLGDVQSLAEQAKKAIGTETAQKLEAKFSSGESFTFEDFLQQLQAMANMGSMTKLLGMLPGNQKMKKQIENFDEREIIKAKSIIQSMTFAERNNPKILNGSRRVRIAKGSGHEVKDVNNLVDRFGAAQKAMKQMRSGGLPGMAGAPQIQKNPIRQSNQTNHTNQKKKSRSGNPAKRAQEEGR